MHQLYVGSLILGVVVAALATVGACGVRLGRVRWRRLCGLARRSRKLETPAYIGGDPGVLLLIGATAFGSFGLVGELIAPALGAPIVCGLAAAVALALTIGIAAAIRAYFRPVAEMVAFQGTPLVGVRGHVSVAIPAGGVGAVAYRADCKRVTRPARTADGRPLPREASVSVVAVLGGTVVVARPLTPTSQGGHVS